jgi:tetratricopeptide (TPR) repeat protein
MIKRLWRWLEKILRRLFISSPQQAVVKEQPRQLLADTEYELLFFQLLAGVNDEDWSHGRVKGFLDRKNIAEADLVQWLRRFGENLLASDGENRELAVRMVRLSEVGFGELGEVAGEIGRELLGREGEEEKREEEVLFERGLQQFDAGDFEGSIISFDKALKIKPHYYQAWHNRSRALGHWGIALDNLGKFEEALVSFDQALNFKHDDHEGWGRRGITLDYLGRYEEAIASYDQAIKFKFDYHEAWNNRGLSLCNLKRYEEAIASYEQAIKFKPDKDEAWYNRGIALGNLGRFEEAIASYDQAIKFKPDDHDSWYNRGLSLCNLKRYEEVIASYDQAIKFKLDYHEAWYNRSVALVHLERYEKAITSYDLVLKLKPDLYEAWYNRSIALVHLERYEEAIISCDQAIKFKPDDHDSWYNRGLSLYILERYEEAITSYDQAIKFKPDKDEAWYNRGIAAGQSISCDQFLTFFSAVARKNPALNQRGYEGELVSYREGLKYCHQDTHPEGWGQLHQAIGNVYYSQGVGERNYLQYWYQAEAEYHQALITLTPKAFPELHLQLLRDLIRVLFGLCKDEEAKKYRKQALEVFGQLLNSPDKSSFQKRQLQAQFTGFSQMRVDVLIEDGDFISALETAERNKNSYLTWILDARKKHILSPSYSDIQKLINSQTKPNTAIIYWHLSPFAITTFIIKPNAGKPIFIPTQQPEKLEAWLKNWHTQYDNHRKGAKQQKSNPDWRDNLPQLLTQLGEILNIPAIIESIQNQNTQIQNLILIPHRDLHRFPLHALFPDEFTTTYLPSTQIGTNLQQKQPISTPTSFLSIEAPNSTDSDGKPFDELRHAEIESATICAMFPNPQRLAGSTASKENITTSLANNHQIAHFTGHATYNYQRPKLSCLALSGTDRFTLEDITQLSLNSYHLVSLSACETAITGNQTIDNEYVGLVSAFLSQGVTHILSTLWTVESVSSALFMIEFYRQPDWHTAPAVALKRTQMWLRNITYRELVNWYKQCAGEIEAKNLICASELLDAATAIEDEPAKINTTIPPYSHPYYWASFIITGKIHT